MADVSEIYGSSNLLKASDLGESEVRECKIDGVRVEDFGDDKKIVLDLESGDSFVLNKTNAGRLSEQLGSSDYSTWTGKSFKLYRALTTYAGNEVPCLRVKQKPKKE